MSYKIKINNKVEGIFIKTAKLAEEIAKNGNYKMLSIPHLMFTLINEDEVAEVMKKEMDFDDEKIKDALNFFLSEIIVMDEVIEHKAKNLDKKSFMINDFLSDLIKMSRDLSEDALSVIDEVDIFNILILKLKEYKDMGASTEYYNIFFEDKSAHQEEYIIHKFKNSIDKITERDFHYDSSIDNPEEMKFTKSLRESLGENDDFDLLKESHEGKNRDAKSLPRYLVSLNKKVINMDDYDSLYMDDEIISRINYVLSKKDKSMPLLVGDSGVGKTKSIHAFCKKIIKKEISPLLNGKNIIEVDLISLFAGCIYRGSLEEKISEMFSVISKEKNVILFVDDLRVNKNSSHQEEFISSFMHYLRVYNVKCILSMNYREYQKSLKSHPQISSNSTVIEINEPSKDVLKSMVDLNVGKYEKYHNVSFSESVIDKIIDLSNKYINDKNNPSKTFEIIDELGALRSSGTIDEDEISEKDVLRIIGDKSKVKISNEKNDLDKYINLSKKIKKKIFGQDHVIDEVASSIMVSAAGFNDETKPYLSLMFTGTTGVGKTEMVKELSQNLNRRMVRYDMSEYSESHTVSKLIGSPSGYIGHDDGGLLTNEIRRNPYSIVLFDEIEKGHPKVFDLFLQILDDGCLTDSQGNKVSFKNTIIIFTSNAGVSEKSKRAIGFNSDSVENKIDFDVLKKYFKPEFLNRINSVIEFNMLGRKVMMDIANKCLVDFEEKLSKNNISLSYTKKVKEYLAENGYDENLGARPMSRLVQKEIIEKFSKIYINAKVKNKKIEKCNISIKDKKIDINVF